METIPTFAMFDSVEVTALPAHSGPIQSYVDGAYGPLVDPSDPPVGQELSRKRQDTDGTGPDKSASK